MPLNPYPQIIGTDKNPITRLALERIRVHVVMLLHVQIQMVFVLEVLQTQFTMQHPFLVRFHVHLQHARSLELLMTNLTLWLLFAIRLVVN